MVPTKVPERKVDQVNITQPEMSSYEGNIQARPSLHVDVMIALWDVALQIILLEYLYLCAARWCALFPCMAALHHMSAVLQPAADCNHISGNYADSLHVSHAANVAAQVPYDEKKHVDYEKPVTVIRGGAPRCPLPLPLQAY